MRGVSFFVALALFFIFVSAPAFADDPAAGASCAGNPEGVKTCYSNGCFKCSSGLWVPQSLQMGNNTASCAAALAGMMRWTGAAMEYCNGTAWVGFSGGASSSPSSLTFIDQTGVSTNSTISSAAVTLGTFSGSATATCGTGCTAIARNGTWGGASVSGFVSGDTIAIRQTSSNDTGVTTTAYVFLGMTISSLWKVTTATNGSCDGTPTAGAVCADGSVYIGLSPDGNDKIYAQRCDLGMTWNGSACAGASHTGYTWNDGSGTMGRIGDTSKSNGKGNTAVLVAMGSSSPAPYKAANACKNSTAHGRSDWYLPAIDELELVWIGAARARSNVATVYGGSFLVNGITYWSSSESDNSNAQTLDYSSNVPAPNPKNNAYVVRCMRR